LLGLIAEENQDLKKAADYFAISANLQQSNSPENWVKIGNLYKYHNFLNCLKFFF